MVKLNKSDIAFFRENFQNHEEIIRAGSLHDILYPLDRLILLKGSSADYEGLNDFGRKAKRVYQNIYNNNAGDANSTIL